MTLRNGLSEELNRQGNEHFSRGFYTDAYTCYAKALECDRLTGDQRALAATLGNLGNICAVSGRRESAQTYYQEVLELQKILGDEKGIGTTLGNLGNLRADAGEWDRAKAYYLEALDLMCKTQDDAGKAVLFSDLGLIAREAIACCQTSQSIAERAHDELRTGGARYVLAQCYEETGKLREAADLLELVVHMDRKYQLPKLQENIQRLAVLHARLAGQDEAPPPSCLLYTSDAA